MREGKKPGLIRWVARTGWMCAMRSLSREDHDNITDTYILISFNSKCSNDMYEG